MHIRILQRMYRHIMLMKAASIIWMSSDKNYPTGLVCLYHKSRMQSIGNKK